MEDKTRKRDRYPRRCNNGFKSRKPHYKVIGLLICFDLTCRIPRCYGPGRLVNEKLASIVALLGVRAIANGQNPLRHLATCLLLDRHVRVDDDRLETLDLANLSMAQAQVLLLAAKPLIEFCESAKFTQLEKHVTLL